MNIEDIISEYLNKDREGSSSSSPKFRVSDAGRCHLMRYWKRKGIPPSDLPDDRSLRIFQVGHMFHRWIGGIIKETIPNTQLELKVEDEHRIGHIDAIATIEGKTILWDFKTVHSRKFWHNKKEGRNGDLHYCLQAATYASMLDIPVDEIRIAYISKDDLCISEVTVDLNEEDIIKDWEPLYFSWVRQTEPNPNPMEWECKYCQYKSKCDVKPNEVNSR